MRSDRGDFYQILLIASLVVVTALFGVFVYREVFPEYKVYQNTYVALEEFRSTYSGESPPPYNGGVTQIVIPEDDKGPETIDRCISCHVAMKLEHFSPTKPAVDVNGNLMVDAEGHSILVDNENYVWGRLDAKIAELRDEAVNAQLEKQGAGGEVRNRLKEADRLEAMKTTEVHGHEYDMTKVLAMHPLMGRETRPFELHSIDDIGCTSCHGGNGRGLVTDRAHGPVFDGQYHPEAHGAEPEFLEPDPDNDPKFAHVFNHKPGHRLLFQTTPLYVGGLMEARCVQCHQSTRGELEGAARAIDLLEIRKEGEIAAIHEGIAADKAALAALVDLKRSLQVNGFDAARAAVTEELGDYALNETQLAAAAGRVKFLDSTGTKDAALDRIQRDMVVILGTPEQVQRFEQSASNGDADAAVAAFFGQAPDGPDLPGSVYSKFAAIERFEAVKQRILNLGDSLSTAGSDERILVAMSGDIDEMTSSYHRGLDLYIANACYACHRIAGFARGGVGPELTLEGRVYPWFVKESIVWPQADLKTSTMPNFHLDHDEVEDLMAFLMAQRGEGQVLSQMQYKVNLSAWEAGHKLPIEQPVSPAKVYDIRESMRVYSEEGCAACHRMTGFASDSGFTAEKEGGSWDAIYSEKEWFRKLFPENISGSEIVATIDKHGTELRSRISGDVRQGSILEELEKSDPDAIAAFYSPFKYAVRAKNKYFSDMMASDPGAADAILAAKAEYVATVRSVMKVYVQEYGLGRLVGPRLNWSGIYRDDEWLIAHFRNPAAHSPKSIMPVLPFDDTKFYALTNLLNVLGQQNRDELRQVWERRGFNPELAYEIQCANCHGDYLHGNGPTAEWIYPIPKDLRNTTFLRNLTKERAIDSIMHGVKGGPMPAWSEVAPDKNFADMTPVMTEAEVTQLVEWLYNALPGSRVISEEGDVPKWQYSPEDVIRELQDAGEELKDTSHVKPITSDAMGCGECEEQLSQDEVALLTGTPSTSQYFVSRHPTVYINEPAGGLTSAEPIDVSEIFDVVDEGQKGSDAVKYFIKRKYYTTENLRVGQELFSLHCSVCHGKEGAGNGIRSEVMVDAKPRMLTNLDWLDTRDDLRLMRSIKYGVQGTSMTPWGDYTSSLQRMQLVMFIRELSRERILRDRLDTSLFEAFERPVLTIGKVRGKRYEALEAVRDQYRIAQDQRQTYYEKVQRSGEDSSEAIAAYQQELRLLDQVNSFEASDQVLADMIASLGTELEVYRVIGINLIERRIDSSVTEKFIELVEANGNRYTVSGGQLAVNTEGTAVASRLQKEIVKGIDDELAAVAVDRAAVEGQLASGQRTEALGELKSRYNALDTLKRKVVSGLEAGVKHRDQQLELFEQLKKGSTAEILTERMLIEKAA